MSNNVNKLSLRTVLIVSSLVVIAISLLMAFNQGWFSSVRRGYSYTYYCQCGRGITFDTPQNKVFCPSHGMVIFSFKCSKCGLVQEFEHPKANMICPKCKIAMTIKNKKK